MTEKEIASKLVWEFAFLSYDTIKKEEIEKAKKCAIKCVEEIIKTKPIGDSLNYYKNIIEEIKIL